MSACMICSADVVDRAYMISKHKKAFFEDNALAEANRYEAAIFTAVEYNQPECVKLMLSVLGHRDLPGHMLSSGRRLSNGGLTDNKLDRFSVAQLAETRGNRIPVHYILVVQADGSSKTFFFN